MDELIQDSNNDQPVPEQPEAQQPGEGAEEDYDEVDFRICGELGKSCYFQTKN